VVHGRAFLEDRKKVALPRKMNPWYRSIAVLRHGGTRKFRQGKR
jgi:hypothetical protein